MTLANKITIFRIVLTPLIVIGLLQNSPVWPLSLFILSAVSDSLDGAAARFRNERTRLGTFLDPLADKLLLVSSFLTLAHLREVPMWVFVVTFSRDLMILLGWTVIYILTQTSTPTPRWTGKMCTFFQMLTIAAVLVPAFRPYTPYVLWPMIAMTVVSALDYVALGVRRLSEVG
jgi:cardiolipin synthase